MAVPYKQRCSSVFQKKHNLPVQSHAPEPISLILCEKKSFEKDNF